MHPKDSLILAMIDTIEALGNKRTAQMDCRLWAPHYRRKAAKLGVRKKVKIPVDGSRRRA